MNADLASSPAQRALQGAEVSTSKALRLVARISLILLLVCHVALVLRQFPVGTDRAHPGLLSNDYPIHFSSAVEAVRFSQSGAGDAGYSGAYMAGYHFGTWSSSSSHVYELTAKALSFLPTGQATYLLMVTAALLTPLLLGLAAYLFDLGRYPTLAATFLGAALFHLDGHISYFWGFGNTVFIFGNAVAVLGIACLWRGVTRHWSWALAAGLVLGLLLHIHFLVALPAALAAMVMLLGSPAPQRPAALRAALLAAGVAGVLALPLLLGWKRYWDLRTPFSAAIPLQANLRHAFFDLLSDRGYRQPLDRRETFHVVVALAALGLWRSRGEERTRNLQLVIAAGLMLAVTYGFCYLPFLRQMQPYRFLASAILFLVVPAGSGVIQFLLGVRELRGQGRLVAVAMAAVLAPNLLGNVWDLLQRRPRPFVSPEMRDCMDWLQQQPGPSGRVMTSDELVGTVGPALTGREFLGGSLSSYAQLGTHWASLGPQVFLGQPVEGLNAERLGRYLDLYGVRYLVTKSEPYLAAARQDPARCKLVKRFGAFSIFQVTPRLLPSVWAGYLQGKVTVQPNRITVADAPSGSFVIPYHYIRGLEGSDGVRVAPQPLLDDPVPFIRIENPTGRSAVSIRFKG